MELTPVDSGMLNAVGYDPATETLTVEFRNGSRYAYTGVDPDVNAEFMASESKGKYFAQNIKGEYECTKIEAEQATA